MNKVLCIIDIRNNIEYPVLNKLFHAGKNKFYFIKNTKYYYWQYGFSYSESIINLEKYKKLKFKNKKIINEDKFHPLYK